MNHFLKCLAYKRPLCLVWDGVSAGMCSRNASGPWDAPPLAPSPTLAAEGAPPWGGLALTAGGPRRALPSPDALEPPPLVAGEWELLGEEEVLGEPPPPVV